MDRFIFNKGDTQITFWGNGDLKEILSHGMMINQVEGNPLDGSLNQLYLRHHTSAGIRYTPMVGSNSESQFYALDDQLTWQGVFDEIKYRVDFQLAENNQWFWRVQLQGTGEIDIVYGQDIGNAAKAAIQSNEAYISQYVDHHVTTATNLVITSRQNQPQDEKFPVVEQGSFQKLIGFSTDGYQFFGKSYTLTNQPEILSQKNLANEVYQYEFAYIAFQTDKVQLRTEVEEFVFYAGVKANYPKVVQAPVLARLELEENYRNLNFSTPKIGKTFKKKTGTPLVGLTLSQEEIARLYPYQTHVEKIAGEIYSFFTDNYHHVVTQAKELNMERSHGHILLSGNDLTVDEPLLSTTVYMCGIFNSQIVLGNTNMNKLMSNSRNALNVLKKSGQRIYVMQENEWRLLTMPSLFEMGLNSACWYYKLADDIIRVRTYTLEHTREVRLAVHSEKQNYTWAVSNDILFGSKELPTYQLDKIVDMLKITGKHSEIEHYYPDLTYYLQVDKDFTLMDGAVLAEGAGDLVVLQLDNQNSFTIKIQGSLTGERYQPVATSFEKEEAKYVTFIQQLLNGFHLSHPTQCVEKMNLVSHWYTHNMLVHYLSPHGLEQYGGAAWGTRDVSQGPTEFFLATNRPEIVASIIRHLYENQFEIDGNWPQWFMFDRYEEQKASESHGDVIVWPMKIVADYLEKTNDFAILKEKLAYTSYDNKRKTVEKYSLYDHLKKEIAYIEAHFLEGTHLSCYGDGDWDDTLQPYDNKLKKNMASSWTVALTYQILGKVASLLAAYDVTYSQHIAKIVAGIKKDFEKYMLHDETIPGFIYMENPDVFEVMIHPKDRTTGIQYRLLPMTRSMIAELLTPEQAQHHLQIIRQHLTFPDGVRLMNCPATYQGGVSTHFKRAEQAANFGREIGLQYVHAHIRFTEAMAKLGERQETWQALNIISPIQIKECVPNAELRQANVYFSSSDGNFKTRYTAQQNFGKLKDRSVGVKGGWRIYSSGPGIYVSQLITNVLGIREGADSLVFDPILPKELSGMELTYKLLGKTVRIKFYPNHSDNLYIDGEKICFTIEDNPYRSGGMKVMKQTLAAKLQEGSIIEIYH